MRENKAKFAILGILSMGPASGYDIQKLFQKSISNVWSEGFGRIYPILKELTNQGLAQKKTLEQKGKPARHVYSITAKGRKTFQQWLLKPVNPATVKIEILLKLFFGDQLKVADNIRQVRHFLELQQRDLEQVEAIAAHVEQDHRGDPGQPYWQMSVSYGRHLHYALIAWCQETLDALQAMEAKPRKHKPGSKDR